MAEKLDTYVEQAILERLCSNEFLAAYAAEQARQQPDLTPLRRELGEIERREDELADQFAGSAVTGRMIRRITATLEARRKEINGELDRLCRDDRSALSLLDLAGDVHAQWAKAGMATKRAVLDELCTVTVLPAGKGRRFSPEHVRIEWKKP